MQDSFCETVDQYCLERDTPDRVEPYLALIRELEQEPDSPFISEKYARWRITGRDNILIKP